MGTSGDKIVLLDGMGSGSGSAANGLLSMIPGMFTSLLGGNKMDPNLVAALMNGRNNQDQFGGANGWWLWIIVLFWLWGGRGFGNGFGGNGNDCCANGLPAQLNNDYGRELLMQAIQGNRSAIDQIANALNCTTTQLQSAICNVQGAPESRDVAMSNNITLACSVDPIMNQLNAAKRTSSDILDSIDKHRRTLEACDSILEEINPAFKQTKDQDRKIKNLEEKVDRMGSSFDELKELLIKKLG